MTLTSLVPCASYFSSPFPHVSLRFFSPLWFTPHLSLLAQIQQLWSARTPQVWRRTNDATFVSLLLMRLPERNGSGITTRNIKGCVLDYRNIDKQLGAWKLQYILQWVDAGKWHNWHCGNDNDWDGCFGSLCHVHLIADKLEEKYIWPYFSPIFEHILMFHALHSLMQ